LSIDTSAAQLRPGDRLCFFEGLSLRQRRSPAANIAQRRTGRNPS
jgi:hypothetical protein